MSNILTTTVAVATTSPQLGNSILLGRQLNTKGHGNDYMKAPVEERFEIKDGTASWKNRSEQGKQAIAGEAFYVPANPPPEFFGVLARALLKAPGHKLPLLPAGEASIEESGKLKVGKTELTQYRITGRDAGRGSGVPRHVGGRTHAGIPSARRRRHF